MAKNLSEVFKEAKKFLWDGTDGKGVYPITEFICIAIDRATEGNSKLGYEARTVIQSRLGYSILQNYLEHELGVSFNEAYHNHKRVQKFRRDWLTSLEKEFAPKLKPKKGYNIHHIDGDCHNNELSNLTYIPEVKS